MLLEKLRTVINGRTAARLGMEKMPREETAGKASLPRRRKPIARRDISEAAARTKKREIKKRFKLMEAEKEGLKWRSEGPKKLLHILNGRWEAAVRASHGRRK
jgi:hypothetical protein